MKERLASRLHEQHRRAALRIIAGLALIVIGLALVGGTGIVLAVVGLVPLGAGARRA